MGCCGNRREQIRAGISPRIDASGATAFQANAPDSGKSKVRYVGSASILVKGGHSSLTYFFSADQPEQFVNSGDTDALLRTGLFQSAE
ncbi:MAG TPA: hypothetical protein VHA33_04035 [Candidatus Angelobacter sp.]|jgi:hypothetical protein|nr:hypothetical protein [Candidatus Angelobacter sp.]